MSKPAANPPTYGFRLKFDLPPGRSFAGVNPRRRLHLGESDGRLHLVRLPKPKRNRFGARTRHAVIGKGFPTRVSAEAAGARVQVALSCLTAERQIGIDARNRAGGSFSKEIKDATAAKHGIQLRDDLHGLDVYAEDKPVTRFAIEAYGSSICRIANYEVRLAAFFQANPLLSDKQRLALDLYNLSHFDGTPKTRFLTLITVVEILSTRRKRSPAVRSVVQEFHKATKASALAPAELRSLTDALCNLCSQSIGEACREFVASFATGDDVQYFSACYRARNELVHAGQTLRNEPTDPTRLDELVSQLLIRSVVGEV